MKPGKLKPSQGREPYPKPFVRLADGKRRRVYEDESGQRWVRVGSQYWRLPEEMEPQ